MPIRILVVDDRPLVRNGLKTLLRVHPEWEIVDEAEDGLEAVEKAGIVRPDVIILDVSMPVMNGLEACRLIRKSAPQSEILIVTQHDSPQMLREAMGAGARGFVVKANLVKDLLPAVVAVSQHRFFPASKSEAGGAE
ncbi:MAG TPA: response regulator transcription factor [Candidatus Angelobacter sp.]|nr:response regulator transcription factor [Candidatus Angelobacter sp.]